MSSLLLSISVLSCFLFLCGSAYPIAILSELAFLQARLVTCLYAPFRYKVSDKIRNTNE